MNRILVLFYLDHRFLLLFQKLFRNYLFPDSQITLKICFTNSVFQLNYEMAFAVKMQGFGWTASSLHGNEHQKDLDQDFLRLHSVPPPTAQ